MDIILLCEMNINKKTAHFFNVPGFNTEFNNRTIFKGGGTAILVREGINYIRRKDLEVNIEKEIESTYQELQARNGKKFIIRSLYRSPNAAVKPFFRHIKDTLPRIRNEKGEKNIILGMDHNLDLLKAHIHQDTQSFIDIMDKNEMHPTITRPTRITNTTATLIDNIFIDKQLFRSFDSCILLEDISDHLPSLAMLKQTKVLNSAPIEFKSRSLNEAKIQQVRDKLFNVDWIGELNSKDVNVNFERLLNIIKNNRRKW